MKASSILSVLAMLGSYNSTNKRFQPLFLKTNFKGRSTISKTLRRKRTKARKAAKRQRIIARK